MKSLSFTPDNLKRHMKRADKFYQYTRKSIYTTRDEMKGRLGDVFDIGGKVYVLDKILPYLASERDLLVNEHYAHEGFSNAKSFAQELDSIYPASKKLYVHIFKELFFGHPIPLCYQCKNMSECEYHTSEDGCCSRAFVKCSIYGFQDLVLDCDHFEPNEGVE